MDEDHDYVRDLFFYVLIRCLGQRLEVTLPTKMFGLETKKFHAKVSSSQESS
jgi:hypothetical protein